MTAPSSAPVPAAYPSPGPADSRRGSRRRFLVVLLLAAFVTFGLSMTLIQTTRRQLNVLERQGRISDIPRNHQMLQLKPKLEGVLEVGYVSNYPNPTTRAFHYMSTQHFLAPILVHDATDQALVVLDFPDRKALEWWCLHSGARCVYDAGNGIGLAER